MARVRPVILAALAVLGAAPTARALVPVGNTGWAWSNPQPQGNVLTRAAFSGPTGYAVGMRGTVLRSSDGGTNWEGVRSPTSQDLRLVAVVDRETVIVAGTCALYRSDDGGGRWRRLPWTGRDEGCPTAISALSAPSADSV